MPPGLILTFAAQLLEPKVKIPKCMVMRGRGSMSESTIPVCVSERAFGNQHGLEESVVQQLMDDTDYLVFIEQYCSSKDKCCLRTNPTPMDARPTQICSHPMNTLVLTSDPRK